MQFTHLVIFILFLYSLCVIVKCKEDKQVGHIERRDVHRIILKPEKSKKHKKRTKSNKYRALQPSYSSEETYHEPSAYHEPSGYASSSTRYQSHHKYQRNPYEYREISKPKPPRHQHLEEPYTTYPEEEPGYYQESASNQHNSYVPYQQQNSGGQLNTLADETQGVDVFVDWNPIPSTPLTNDYRPHELQHHDTSPPTKRNKRKKKPHLTTTSLTTTTTSTTTTRSPLHLHHHASFLTQPLHGQTNNAFKAKNPHQHHYVNYNHNDKSHIKYEVSSGTKPNTKQFSAPLPLTIHHNHQNHHNHDSKTAFSNLSNSYEVYERAKDYNKQIKQTSFKSSLVPQPLYPQLQPFLPTVSTYTIAEKSTFKPVSVLDFGKKNIATFGTFPKKSSFP